jgi:uncharacterized protein (TIGR00297 family)
MTRGSRQGARSAFSETRRQIVHITMGAWALLLYWISWRQAAALAIAALAFNLFVLPRVGRHGLYRESEVTRGLPIGILLYPLAVLGLVLVFPYRLDIVAAAWGIMAAGDGFATLVGRRFGRTPLPWNPEKSLEGTLAFIACGSAAGVLLALWVRTSVWTTDYLGFGSSPFPPVLFSVIAPIVAATVAAFVETIPVRLDDNISVPFSAAFTLWVASHVSVDVRQLAGQWPVGVMGLALNAAVASAGWFARTVSVSGAVAGAIIGTIIFVGAGWPGWILLLAAFLSASIVSRIGLRRKEALGIAEERGGRRGAGNAIANTGVAACAAGMGILGGNVYYGGCLMAMSAALVAGASDTVASELGKAWGRRTVLVPSFRRVPPGTPGAISLEGTAAGIVSAIALAALAGWLGLLYSTPMSSDPGGPAHPPATEVGILVVAATAASFVESLLGASLEPKGILNNDLLNFVTTWTAAAIAMFLVLL